MKTRIKGLCSVALSIGFVGYAAAAWAGAAGSAAASATAAAAPVGVAATPRFELPFACGQTWFAATYAGHLSNAVDWNLGGAGESDFGVPVLAGAAGVAHVLEEAGYGLEVIVDHGGGWQSRYAHLSATDVRDGATVDATTVVGRVGHSGRSDGSHLHHEQLLNGQRQPIAAHGAFVEASYSTRGASYTSANCAPAAPAAPAVSTVAATAPVPATTPTVRVESEPRTPRSAPVRARGELAPGVIGESTQPTL